MYLCKILLVSNNKPQKFCLKTTNINNFLFDNAKMKENYFIIIAQANDVIKEFEKKVLEIFFTSDTGMQLETASNPYMCFTPVYVQYSYPIKIVIELFDLLKIENLKKDVLDTFVKNLNNPIYVSERARFKHTIDALSDVFEKTKEDIENAVRKL